MRYRSFLVILLLAAPATWLWAEPSKEVIVQTPLSQRAEVALETEETTSPQDGWTYDISGPAVLDSSAIQSLVPKLPIETPTYTRADIALDVFVTPGDDFDSTQFDVRVLAPDESKRTEYFFRVLLNDDPSQFYGTTLAQPVGPDHFRFFGADLKLSNSRNQQSSKRPQITGSISCVVSTRVNDPKQSRFSRGASSMIVRSEPIQLSLR